MIGAITGLLTALPQILNLIKELGITAKSIWEWLEKVSGNDSAGYIVKIGVAFNQLNNAKTPEDHGNAAQSISNLLRGLPSS